MTRHLRVLSPESSDSGLLYHGGGYPTLFHFSKSWILTLWNITSYSSRASFPIYTTKQPTNHIHSPKFPRALFECRSRTDTPIDTHPPHLCLESPSNFSLHLHFDLDVNATQHQVSIYFFQAESLERSGR
jgi:hypothetical protein